MSQWQSNVCLLDAPTAGQGDGDLCTIKECAGILAGVAQCIECWTASGKATVRFPARAHAWAVGHVPSGGHARGNQSMFLSLSSPLYIKSFKKECVG